MKDFNFANILARQCSSCSRLIDAATGNIIGNNRLEKIIASVGGFFSTQNFSIGDRIIIGCKLNLLSSLAYMGSMYAGLVPVPIELNLLKKNLHIYIKATEAKAVWVEDKEIFNDMSSLTGIHELYGDIILKAPEVKSINRRAEDLAALMVTSGSTGKPHFVKISHGNLIANTKAIVKSQHLTNNECAMLILPISYCFGASILHTHLFCGGSVVFDSRFMFPDKVLYSIEKYDCTTFAGVPSVYKLLLKHSNLAKIRMPRLRRYLQAGGHLDFKYIEQIKEISPNVDFYVMYGQTEATARITTLEPNMLFLKKGSVGRTLENIKLYIKDKNGKKLPPNVRGQIWVSGPSISSGYWNESSMSTEVLKNGWLNTRDFGKLDNDGYLWIDGRNVDFIKIRGRRITFGEIEERVREIAGIHDVAACSVPHDEAGESPVIFFVPEQNFNIKKLIKKIKESIPHVWTCKKIIAINKLPLTNRGKLNREKLTLLEQKTGEECLTLTIQ
ncbi:AMP-binding protein [Candidatus Magnetomoraceae bacterium gMMP-15]